jgi:TonB-linked SusC/RagA family outer membrane protein
MIYDMNDYGGSLISGYFSNPLEHIDIKDVDNITVVKDATSTYGSKGANGAIFITTAHAQELATHIDFSASTGINFAPKSLPVMGASDYRIYVAEVLKSAGFSDTYIQSQPYMNDDPQALNYYRYHNNTNWQDKVLRNSITQNYSLRVTGGDNLAKLSLLIGHLDQKGIVNNTDFKRSSIRFNSDLNITPKLTATTHLSFSYSTHNLAEEGVSDKTNPVLLSLVKAPILHTNEMSDEGQVSPNLAGVDIFNISNPLQVTNKMIAQNTAYRFFGSANFKYQINDRFNVSSMFNITLAKISENFFVPSHGVVADTLYNALAKSRMGAQVQRTFATSTDTRIEYVKPLTSVHNVSARLGLRSIGNRSEEDFGLGYNSATDELQTIGTGVTVLRQTGGDLGKWTWINYYGAVDYSMFNKYFVSFNIAMDGSSRFGDEANGVSLYNNKFGVFPSVAAGWLISSENFMNDINMIEMLKLRASYGLTGNDDIGNYSAKRYYVSQNLIGMQGIILGNLANPALQWESVRKLNVGIDMALLNERLFFSVDVFRNVTDNMITYETVESITGIDKIVTNGGGMKNHGVELALNGRALDKEFKVDLGLNFSVYRNEVTELPSEMTTSYAGATILTRVGAPMGVFYGYETRGVFASSEEASAYSRLQANGTYAPFQGGDMRFVDRNGDFIIDEDDRTVIGDPNPDFTGSFSARVAWKRFVFDAAFTFSYGNDVYNSTRAQLESASGFENQTKAIVNRWRTEGQVTDVPRASWDDPSGNARFSDRWIEDGSYLRLRTVSLNYTLPYRKEITIYCSGNNLLTFSRYLGYDPEFSASNSALLQGIDAGMTPQYKSLLVGVRVGL